MSPPPLVVLMRGGQGIDPLSRAVEQTEKKWNGGGEREEKQTYRRRATQGNALVHVVGALEGVVERRVCVGGVCAQGLL